MNRTGKLHLGATTLAAALIAPIGFAQVFVDEQFNYADQAALDANWTLSTNSVLTLDSSAGNALNPGTGTNPNIWAGSTFTLDPSDAAPVRFTADLISDGTVNSVTTVGLRTGANPLFEMGMYRLFDNVLNPDGSTSPGTGSGIGVRTINVGSDLPGQDWVKMGEYYTGSARFEATFGESSVTTRIDLGIDGTWDFTYTETGTTPMGNFSELRVHAPVAGTAGNGAIVDNIRVEVVPEPSTFALLGLGGLLFAALRRRTA
ncbi:MAG TPA: PEP-CTERM sorting domain-containing protein [Verrucomicrobiae bacterium]